LKSNEELLVELAPGKSILVKLLYLSETDEDGNKHVFFKLNGQTRSIEVKDKSFTNTKKTNKKVSAENEIGAPLQGKLSRILVNEGDVVEKNAALFTIEAMKMESTIVAAKNGKVTAVVLEEGVFVQQDDVVVVLD
jgi:pyruvate carboxylase